MASSNQDVTDVIAPRRISFAPRRSADLCLQNQTEQWIERRLCEVDRSVQSRRGWLSFHAIRSIGTNLERLNLSVSEVNLAVKYTQPETQILIKLGVGGPWKPGLMF